MLSYCTFAFSFGSLLPAVCSMYHSLNQIVFTPYSFFGFLIISGLFVIGTLNQVKQAHNVALVCEARCVIAISDSYNSWKAVLVVTLERTFKGGTSLDQTALHSLRRDSYLPLSEFPSPHCGISTLCSGGHQPLVGAGFSSTGGGNPVSRFRFPRVTRVSLPGARPVIQLSVLSPSRPYVGTRYADQFLISTRSLLPRLRYPFILLPSHIFNFLTIHTASA